MAWHKSRYGSRFPVYVSVAERKARALRAAEKLGRKENLDPVIIEGALAVTWWGKAWNRNLEAYADYSNRLPRGRSYARHGSVIDLRIEAGSISALVQGSQSRPYEVKISIAAMDADARALLIEACAGKLDSAEALLSGRFPEDMDRLLIAETTGLFPHPRGIRFSCSCPDSASLCKHVAAALYSVGARLDRDPALFFRLRDIELENLVSQAVKSETRKLLQAKATGESVLMRQGDGELSALFGIDLGDVGKKPVRTGSSMRKAIPSQAIAKPNRKTGRGIEVQEEIKGTLQGLESLSREMIELESQLRSLLE